jgi:hypothetical protein
MSRTTTPAIPPELLPHFRRVRTRLGHGCTLWGARLFILPHMLVGLGLLLAVPAACAWALFGTDHTARVQRVWETRGSKGKISYHAEYAYDLPTGARQSQDNVSFETFTRFQNTPPAANLPVTIRVRSIGHAPPLFYDTPLEPGESPWAKIGFIFLFAAFWNGILSVFVYQFYVTPWRTRRLFRSGTAAPGTVISKRAGGSKNRTFHVGYQFRTPDGKTRKGESIAAPKDAWDKISTGDPITVLYDPNDPDRRSVAYDYGDYYCVPT